MESYRAMSDSQSGFWSSPIHESVPNRLIEERHHAVGEEQAVDELGKAVGQDHRVPLERSRGIWGIRPDESSRDLAYSFAW